MKSGKILLVLILCVVCLVGCNTLGNNTEPSNNMEIKKIAESTLPEITSEWSEVSRYTGDVNGDGADENVVLLTSAKRDADKNIMWNDRNEWVLYITGHDGTYVLLDETIQLGNVYFEVIDYYKKDGAEPKINVIKSTGSFFEIKSYSFDKKEKVYHEEKIYNTSDVTDSGTNLRFSSIPTIN